MIERLNIDELKNIEPFILRNHIEKRKNQKFLYNYLILNK